MALCLVNLEEVMIKGGVYLHTSNLLQLFLPESLSLIQIRLEVCKPVLSVKRQKMLMLQMLQMYINSLDVAKLSGHVEQE